MFIPSTQHHQKCPDTLEGGLGVFLHYFSQNLLCIRSSARKGQCWCLLRSWKGVPGVQGWATQDAVTDFGQQREPHTSIQSQAGGGETNWPCLPGPRGFQPGTELSWSPRLGEAPTNVVRTYTHLHTCTSHTQQIYPHTRFVPQA